MRILKTGDLCPCCGTPIRGDTPRWKLLLLSYIAEGMSLMDVINALGEVIELSPMGDETSLQSAPEPMTDTHLEETETEEGAEKKSILQRLKDYRAAHGLGSLEYVSKNTAHNRSKRLTSDTLRMLLTGDTQIPVEDWRKIGRALDRLKEQSKGEEDHA